MSPKQGGRVAQKGQPFGAERTVLENSVVFVVALAALMWRAPGLGFYLASPDHGYQISLGHQLVAGSFPFVDMFFHYGPLTALTSGFGLFLWDSLIPETLVCAVGYAGALTIIYIIVRRHSSSLSGLFAVVAGYVLLARFYKWYYWLFPLAALYCFQRLLTAPENERSKWIVLSGLLDGLAALYRLDLGLACFCFHLVCIVGWAAASRDRSMLVRSALLFFLGASAPLTLWVAALAWEAGLAGVHDYLSASFAGARGAVEGMSLPLPEFSWERPWSDASRAAMAFLLVPITYVIALGIGVCGRMWGPTPRKPLWGMLIATALLGLGILPQALHRADAMHLLQVIPPFVIATSLSAAGLYNLAVEAPTATKRALAQCGAVSLLAVLVICACALERWGRYDLAPWSSSPGTRYRELATPRAKSVTYPLGGLVDKIRTASDPCDPLLVAGNGPQFYFFADRPMAGILNCYVPGVFADREWSRRDMDKIRRNPPRLVVVPAGFPKMTGQDPTWFGRQELLQFVREDYTERIYSDSSWLVLARSQAP